MSFLGDFHREFLQTLAKHNVTYLVVGGQAAIYYGVRRGTGDLDILLEPTIENGKKIVHAFKELKLQIDDLRPEEFKDPLFLGLGFEPDAVDLFTTTPGIDFHTSYKRSKVISDGSLEFNLISLQDLIKNKESLNREGEKKILDQYDAAVLKKILRKN